MTQIPLFVHKHITMLLREASINQE
jgi:hypothetical protein